MEIRDYIGLYGVISGYMGLYRVSTGFGFQNLLHMCTIMYNQLPEGCLAGLLGLDKSSSGILGGTCVN